MSAPRHYFPMIGAQFPAGMILAGSFLCNGADAPSLIAPAKRAKFTISAPSPAGIYTVTLADGPLPGLVSAFCGLADSLDANSTKRAFLGNVNNLQAGLADSFTIVTQSTTGTAANIAAASVCFVHFALIFSESSLVK